MEIYGKIVKLRAIEPEDLEMLREMKNDPWAESLVGGWSLPISKAQQLAWYQRLSEEKNIIRFIIETEKDGAVGFTTLTDIDWKNRSACSGTMLAKKHISKGIATDAVMARLKYSFDELQLNRIEANILAHNIASQRLVEKVGYKVEGTKRQAIYKNGKYNDVIIYSILKSEYETKIKETNYWGD
jgi:RimJ/RimL family protein N-acetyltransferase